MYVGNTCCVPKCKKKNRYREFDHSGTQGGSKQFPALSKTQILMSHYYHSLSVDATIIGDSIGIIFVTQ